MDDAGRPAVEFLDGAPDRDEVLAGAPRRDSRYRVIVLLGTLLLVAAGALAARAAQGSGPTPAASAAAASTPPPAESSAPVGTSREIPIPSGCQTAGCVVVSGIPPSTERAVHAVFPTAVLQEGYSVMTDDLRSLRSRNLRGVLDGAEFVVDVGAAPPVRQLHVRGRRDGPVLRAVARVSRYRITITAADPRVELNDLMRLARQPALIAPR